MKLTVLKAVLLVLATLLASPALATSITLPYIFVPNTIIVSTQVNANFSIIAGVVNGNVDNSNLSAGANISLSKLNATQSFLDLQAASGTLGIGVGQTGDSVPRVGLYSDGSIQFGPGSSTAVDVELKRSATLTLQLSSPGAVGTPIFDLTQGIEYSNSPNPIPGGRLYLTTGSPVANANAAANVYYGPYRSNTVTISNGTNQVPQTFAQTTLSLSALSTATVYDIYITSASPTTISFVTVAWGGINTPPTRSTDSYGRLCANGTPADLLVGSIYVNGSNQTVDNTSERWVSNIYNAVPRAMNCTDTTTDWTTSSTTPVTANGSTTDGIGSVSFVQAVANACGVNIVCFQNSVAGAAGNDIPIVGFGINSTSAYTVSSYGAAGTASNTSTVSLNYALSPSAGYTYVQRLNSATAGSPVFYGATGDDGGATGNNNGLSFVIWN